MKEEKDFVIYVDDEPENLSSFELLFFKHYQIKTFTKAKEAIQFLQNHHSTGNPVKVVLSDQRMPEMSGIEFLEKVRKDFPDISAMLITGYSSLDLVIEAINKLHIYKFINKPWVFEDLKQSIDKAIEFYNLKMTNQNLILDLAKKNTDLNNALKEVEKMKQKLEAENEYLREEIKLDHNFQEIITKSEKLKNTLKTIEQVAPGDTTVLIHGETGTGKELIARAIHQLSNRKNHALVKVNCAALPEELIESELFGHEKGAFTGAIKKREGRFELADQGTLFLDEIGELPLALQAKLLRVLQEGEFERLGGTSTIKVNVRIIAATNRNLSKEVDEGRFRSDLYYRLNVFPLIIPPLRERLEDVDLLTKHFVDKYCQKLGKNIQSIPMNVLNKLRSYTWPGNIRELENLIERAVIISYSGKLEIGDWFESNQPVETILDGKFLTMEEMEKKHISNALEVTNGKISGKNGAADLLNINYSTLRSRMKKLDIN